MPKKNKSLNFNTTRENFQKHIDLWLQEAAADEEKKESCEIGEMEWYYAAKDQSRHEGMAQALIILGRRIGVITANEYPQFPQ